MGKIESKEKIYWVNDLDKAILIAGLTRKPVFLLILKSLCPTCKTMEPAYVQDKDFRVLSKFFVMSFPFLRLSWLTVDYPGGMIFPREMRQKFRKPSQTTAAVDRSCHKPKRVVNSFMNKAKSVDVKQVEETYAIDGHYVPRILFLDSNGKPMEQFYNRTTPKTETKYFYAQVEEIVNTMKNVLYHFYSFNKEN